MVSQVRPIKPTPAKSVEKVTQSFVEARENVNEEDVYVEFVGYSEPEENDYNQTIYPVDIRYHIDMDPAPMVSPYGVDTGTLSDGSYVEATGRRTEDRDVATYVFFDDNN